MKCRCVEYSVDQIGATSRNGQRQLVASRLWETVMDQTLVRKKARLVPPEGWNE
jgi:hypothetical protein